MRYDAELKQYPQLLHFIQQHFTFIGVCPEVEMGLNVPRPPVQLSGTLNHIKMRGRDDASIDVTDKMQNYCQQRAPQLNSICGYIFKSQSPSCGIKDIPLFDDDKIINVTRGLFANAILQHYPKLPITDEQGLKTSAQCNDFLHRVKQHQQTNNDN
ncbi:hypothetical protein MNBD_GAMMA08-622 [hydrothermal vent metagenome]|uniref:Uncharacterized protein n=1 Tax=hydrothermal vent metagenome TaxID=652676 RepID=A0A3B0WZU2_9ZZZZ